MILGQKLAIKHYARPQTGSHYRRKITFTRNEKVAADAGTRYLSSKVEGTTVAAVQKDDTVLAPSLQQEDPRTLK